MKFLTTKIKSGFTLIEVITVLFVVSLGLVGVLTLIVQNIQSQSINKNNLIAGQLAQEGIELIRKTRDSNWRQSLDWDENLEDGTYYMDYRDSAPHELVTGDASRLKQDADGFFYHDIIGTSQTSNFSRIITLDKEDSHTFFVRSQVTWGEHEREYSYDLETKIYGWK
jgi:prepilin-type N-terminal cleavage/methylation domain-containing protein